MPEQNLTAEKLAKKIMANLQKIEAQRQENAVIAGRPEYAEQSYYKRFKSWITGEPPNKLGIRTDLSAVLVPKLALEEGDPLFKVAQTFEKNTADVIKSLGAESVSVKLEGAFKDLITNLNARTVGFDVIQNTWQTDMVRLQKEAEEQYNAAIINATVAAAKAVNVDPTLKVAIDAAIDRAADAAKKVFKDATSAADAEQANALCSKALSAIIGEPARIINLCQANQAAQQSFDAVHNTVGDLLFKDPASLSSAEATKLKAHEKAADALVQAEAALKSEGVDPAVAVKANLEHGAPDTSKVAALGAERDTKIKELKALENTQEGSKFHEELRSVEKATRLHKEVNQSRMRENSIKDFTTFELLLADKVTEESIQARKEAKEAREAQKQAGENGMSLGGKNPLEKLEELESGIYKYKKNKDDPSSKKEGMVHYDANSHEAYPVPMTGRATGYKLLDRAFREEWGAVFDRLARFGTISVNVEPDKENLTSLKVMVDLVKERNKLVELSPSALQLVTAHMSKKKAAAFIEMINAHNKKMEAAFVTPHHAGVMDADKKAAAERAAMDAIDKQSKVVSAEIHNLNAEAHPTKDKLNESLDAVSLLAEQVNDLAKQLESKPSEELNNDHAITSIDNAMVVIRGALGAIDDAAGKGVPLEDADKVQMNDIMSSLEKAAQITANAQVNLEQNQKAAPQSPAAPSA